ncbi:hypothetical protein Lpp120_0774 [Lacticaseibacillus paracasei subsp. paracasei Lpp120]|nr:hypothetical protein Lpp120_0774 [Lacticaseibacillus paracasei subsp. paracasei Lpp120]
MLNSIGIHNLKSLKDTDNITLGKLTVLLGRNSIGKSTFLRTFALLKQSISADRVKPIIWYTSDLVDFGSFEDAVSRENTKNEDQKQHDIGFDFDFSLSKDQLSQEVYFRGYHQISISNSLNVHMEVAFDAAGNLTTTYKIADWVITLKYTRDKEQEYTKKIRLTVNDYDFSNSYVCSPVFSSGELVPSILEPYERNQKAQYPRFFDRILREKEKNDPVTKELSRKLKVGRISDKTIYGFSRALRQSISTKSDFASIFQKKISQKKLMKKQFDQLGSGKAEYVDGLYRLCGLSIVPELVFSANQELNKYFSQVQYIAPVRATAQRYYRSQDLAVNSINPKGQNVPAMLSSMNQDESKAWKKWTKDHFNISFDIETSGDNDSIFLTSYNCTGEKKSNLSDVGFGYSQILPILLYVWRQNRTRKNRSDYDADFGTTTILIEQPELHLHPALQATEMHALDELLSESNNVRMMIETHSEYMVKQIGHDIANNLISAKDVKILIFDDQDNDGFASISPKKFTEQGYFENWPIGFFQPDYR